MSTEITLSTINQAELKLIEEHGGEDWSNEYVEAAAAAFEAVQAFYKKMEPGRAPGSHRVDYDRIWDLASFRRNYFKPALARAELPGIRVHDLCHAAASLWLAAGFPPSQVSRWLGHAGVVTTDTIYSHLYPTDYAQHVERFARFSAVEG